jgi:ribosomal protein S27AE
MTSLREFVASIFRRFGRPSSGDQVSSGTVSSSRMRLDDDAELTAWFRQNECCPDCGGADFLAGPRGGLSQNMECSSCGAEYNIARYEGRIIIADRIRRDPVSSGVVTVTTPPPQEPRMLH